MKKQLKLYGNAKFPSTSKKKAKQESHQRLRSQLKQRADKEKNHVEDDELHRFEHWW